MQTTLARPVPASQRAAAYPIAAGAIAGGLAAIVASLVSLGLPSPDPVFFNPLFVSVGALSLGGLSGLAWRVLGRGQVKLVFGMVWVLGWLGVMAAAVVLEGLLVGTLRYVLPLAATCFALTGGLTPLLASRLHGPRRWAAPAAAVLSLGLGTALVSRAMPAPAVLDTPVATAVVIATTPPQRIEVATAVATGSLPLAAPKPAATTAPTRAAVRTPGHYAGVNFVVGSGSKITFTVKEQLARMPLPNEAVVTSSALTGELHLDGRPSTIQLDLQRLSSDQPNRDKYIRSTLFPQDRQVSFTVDDVAALQEGSAGQPLEGQVSGALTLKGGTFPLTFDWQGRDEGDVFYLTGHTTFGWKDVGLETPTSSAIVSAADTVALEVVLAARPK